MTWNWDDVTSTCLTPADEAGIQATADAYFPTDRDTDIETLVSTVTQLNDDMKVQAEFWAGQPYTVSPPGQIVYLWAMFFKSSNFAKTQGMTSFILSGLQLTVTLFEAGRVVWGLKKFHSEARPIQDIRLRYTGSTIASYDGTLIDGSTWIPYQTADVVTPPFPDFPSGHSAFSQCFVNIMSAWFGPDIPVTKPIELLKMSLLSPIFKVNQIQPTGVFVFPSNASMIQTGVPATNITLQFSQWQDMATSCGYSRQYGGIHAMSAHLGSQQLANSVYHLVNESWGFVAAPPC